ncbi:MAG TPA: hypothetical protein VNN55_11265 [bacterium]|nr:hypothetical protein [bacterium]
MKKAGVVLGVLLVLSIIVLDGVALLTATTARATDGGSTFSAGDVINQGGQIVGCRCPRLRGPCVCQYDDVQK